MLLSLRVKVFELEFEFQVLTYCPLRQSEFRIAIFKEEKKMLKICLQPCHHQLWAEKSSKYCNTRNLQAGHASLDLPHRCCVGR